MPLNDIGRFHVSKMLVDDMTVADTLIGAVGAEIKENTVKLCLELTQR